jgi:uncharacterized membrane protein YhaH (DUF805 family)
MTSLLRKKSYSRKEFLSIFVIFLLIGVCLAYTLVLSGPNCPQIIYEGSTPGNSSVSQELLEQCLDNPDQKMDRGLYQVIYISSILLYLLFIGLATRRYKALGKPAVSVLLLLIPIYNLIELYRLLSKENA